MAYRQLRQFFNNGNIGRIERLLTEEGVTLNIDTTGLTKTAANDRTLNAMKEYFSRIGMDETSHYVTRDHAISRLRTLINEHKHQVQNQAEYESEYMKELNDNHFHDDWESYEEHPFVLPINYDADVDDVFDLKSSWEELTDSLWDELPRLAPETKSFKPQAPEDELAMFLQSNKPARKYKAHDDALWCNKPEDEDASSI